MEFNEGLLAQEAQQLSVQLSIALEMQEKANLEVERLKSELNRLREQRGKCPECKIGTLEPIAGERGFLTCTYCEKKFPKK